MLHFSLFVLVSKGQKIEQKDPCLTGETSASNDKQRILATTTVTATKVHSFMK